MCSKQLIPSWNGFQESAIRMDMASVGIGEMTVQMFSRFGAGLFLMALVSGCSSIGLGDSARSNECKWNRSSCMHEGSYEPGEREYAEQEAKHLNQAASARLRRSSGK